VVHHIFACKLTDLEGKNLHFNQNWSCILPAFYYLPVWLWVLGSYQERCTQDWCTRSVVCVKAVRNQMVPPCGE